MPSPFGPLACAILPDLGALQYQVFLDNEYGTPVLRVLNTVLLPRIAIRLARGSHGITLRRINVSRNRHHTVILLVVTPAGTQQLEASLFMMSAKAQRSLDDPEEERMGPSRGSKVRRAVTD
jgi:hypothetical protein